MTDERGLPEDPDAREQDAPQQEARDVPDQEARPHEAQRQAAQDQAAQDQAGRPQPGKGQIAGDQAARAQGAPRTSFEAPGSQTPGATAPGAGARPQDPRWGWREPFAQQPGVPPWAQQQPPAQGWQAPGWRQRGTAGPDEGRPVPGQAVPGNAAQGEGGPDQTRQLPLPDDGGSGAQPPVDGAQPVDGDQPGRRRISAVATIVTSAVLAILLGASSAAITVNAMQDDSTSAPAASGSSQGITINNPENVSAVTAVAAKASPSVVTISATDGSSQGTGSGVILDDEGHIVTNNHVVTVGGATRNPQLRVTLSDGRSFEAKVVGLDPTMDLAVVQMQDASNLTPVTVGDSGKLNVGETVVAIGAPQGLENTVTSGVVSALNRGIALASTEAPEDGGDSSRGDGPFFSPDLGEGSQQQQSTSQVYLSVIQTDAAINPGNSGGALVNGKGELIGVNVAIATSGGSSGAEDQAGNIGIGFAIQGNVVKRITDELIKNGTATHGQLGATVNATTQQAGATEVGARIQSVTADGAAAKAGLRAGDTITQVDGVRISDGASLIANVRQSAPGATVTVTYQRGGESREAEVTLGSATDE